MSPTQELDHVGEQLHKVICWQHFLDIVFFFFLASHLTKWPSMSPASDETQENCPSRPM